MYLYVLRIIVILATPVLGTVIIWRTYKKFGVRRYGWSLLGSVAFLALESVGIGMMLTAPIWTVDPWPYQNVGREGLLWTTFFLGVAWSWMTVFCTWAFADNVRYAWQGSRKPTRAA